MESAREARRRKILERGSDRLAFITGQSRSPTPSASFSSPLAPALEPQQHQEKENPRSTTTGTTSSPECTVGGRDLSVLEKTSIVLEGTRILSKESVCEHASIYDLHHGDAAGVEAHKHQPIDQTFNTEELLPEDDADREFSSYETSSEFAKCKMGKRFQGGKRKEATAYAEQDGKIVEPSTSPIAHISSDQVVDRAPYVNSPLIHQVLTSKQISRAISASENIRLLCAVSVALLVVMSTRGYSFGTIANFRPLCLVLLTDTTVVIGHLFVSRKSQSEDGEEARRRRQDKIGLANNIGTCIGIKPW